MENYLWENCFSSCGQKSIFHISHSSFSILIFHLGVDQAFSSYLFPVLL